jgi:hypothetical protein
MDPQTSGGLLAAVTPEVGELLAESGEWTVVGEFISGGPALEIV